MNLCFFKKFKMGKPHFPHNSTIKENPKPAIIGLSLMLFLHLSHFVILIAVFLLYHKLLNNKFFGKSFKGRDVSRVSQRNPQLARFFKDIFRRFENLVFNIF